MRCFLNEILRILGVLRALCVLSILNILHVFCKRVLASAACNGLPWPSANTEPSASSVPIINAAFRQLNSAHPRRTPRALCTPHPQHITLILQASTSFSGLQRPSVAVCKHKAFCIFRVDEGMLSVFRRNSNLLCLPTHSLSSPTSLVPYRRSTAF